MEPVFSESFAYFLSVGVASLPISFFFCLGSLLDRWLLLARALFLKAGVLLPSVRVHLPL